MMIVLKIVIIMILYILFFLDVKKNSKYFDKPIIFYLNRFIVITIIALLLFNFKFSFNFSNKSKDKISIFIDNSLSVGEQIKNNNKIVEELADFIKHLDQKKIFFDIYSFDSEVNRVKEIDQFNFLDNQTDFSKLLTYIRKIGNENNIIVSDGVNTGSFIDDELRDLNNIKVFSLGLGEDLIFEDISINDAYFVNSDFLSDSVMFVVDFSSTLNNDIKKKIEFVFNDNLENKYENINFSSGSEIYGSKKFFLKKQQAKSLKYIKIDSVESERNISNNLFYVKYNNLFEFRSVLLISGQLNNNTTYIKKIIKLLDIDLFFHQYKIKSKWNKQYDLTDIDLIVFDSYPLTEKDIIDFQQYEKLNTKIVLIPGMQKNLKINDFISDLADLEYSIEENKSKFIFTNKDEIDNLLPPIQSSVNWVALDNKNCLLQYGDKSCAIAEKNNSVFIFINNLQSYYLQLKSDIGSSDIFNDLVLKSLFVGLNDQSALVQTKFKKNNFNLNEQIDVQFIPSLGIDSKLVFEISNTSDSLIFVKEIPNFSQIEKIKFNLTNLGKYNCTTKLVKDKNILFEKVEEIIVNSINIEEKNLFLNEQYLKNISKTTNAKYFHINELNDLISNFDSSERTKIFNYTLSYLSINKFIWLLIILISLDWYIRTRKGIL